MTGAHPWSVKSASILQKLRARAGRVKRALSRTLDRSLHPGRRERARSELRSLDGVERVLFLCLGNVCRSPYAEARFRSHVGGVVAAGSAGFIGPGRTPPNHAVEAARARGLDTSEHRSRLVTSTLLAEADLVVVMDSRQLRRVKSVPGRGSAPIVVLGDLDPAPIPSRTINDPWGRGHDVFAAVFARIDRCIEELSANLALGGHPRASLAPGEDIEEMGSETCPCPSTTSR